ncbi:MAG: LacI family DNA-binding transcriptional regulator [Marinosulfonomonas sp.]
MKHSRPTLRTISELTGLSLSTVSLALRGGEKLKAETREKVREAAERVGYVPDKAGVRLRTGRADAIGIILDGREDSVGFSRNLIRGINDAAGERSISLNVYPEFDRVTSERTIRTLVSSGHVDGLILTHTEPQDRRVKMLLELDFPFATHGRTELFTPHAYHDFDSAGFVEMGLRLMADGGAKHVLAVLSDNKTFNHRNVWHSFETCLGQFNLTGEVHEDRPVPEQHISQIRKFGMKIAKDGVPYDAILCDNELVAISLVTGLRDAGVVVGKDLQIVSKQTSNLLPALFPNVIGLEETVYESGKELARLLFDCMDGVDVEKLQTLAKPILHRST